MSEYILLIKIIICILGMQIKGYEEGVGAYYADGVMQKVCEYRVTQGWNDLNCSWPCLVSGIEPEHIGEYWLIYHSTLGYHI